MRHSAGRSWGAALTCLLVIAGAGCSSNTPARLDLPSGEVLRGKASTSLNGQYYVAGARTQCTGTYEGRNIGGIGLSAGRKSVVTVQCSNGKTGASNDRVYDTGQARLRLNDGSTARLRMGDGL